MIAHVEVKPATDEGIPAAIDAAFDPGAGTTKHVGVGEPDVDPDPFDTDVISVGSDGVIIG